MLHEEISQMEWQGKQVYITPTCYVIDSRMILNQLTPLLPKDSEELNAQVKCLHAMLDATTMTNPALDQEDRW
jgi:cbb3-type cytochrome oxidase cytochrome c subunit